MKKIMWFAIAFVWVVLDQWSKVWAVVELKEKSQIIDVLPVLRFLYAENTGAAFGFLANQPGWQKWFFLIVGSVATVVLVAMIIKSEKTAFWSPLGLTCILGGAIGNVYDRAVLGYVRDMISVYYTPWEFNFAIFNVADMAISIGVGCLIIDWILDYFKQKPKA